MNPVRQKKKKKKKKKKKNRKIQEGYFWLFHKKWNMLNFLFAALLQQLFNYHFTQKCDIQISLVLVHCLSNVMKGKSIVH